MAIEDSDVTIAVMGATGSGKTTFINMASGSSLDVSKGLKSCTSVVQTSRPFVMDGRSVTLIDTPGFDDTTKSESDILRMIAEFLSTAYEHGKKLAGVIYIHRISDFRMSGISTRNFKMFRQLCGDSTLKNVVIVTNMWGEVSRDVGEAREAELLSQDMFFKPVLDNGAIIMRHDNTPESARKILAKIVQNQPMPLQIQREMVEEKKDISQTAVGEELNRELNKQTQMHQKEMQQLREEMRGMSRLIQRYLRQLTGHFIHPTEAIRTKDEEAKRKREIETRKLQVEMNRVQADSYSTACQRREEQSRLERRMQELSTSARQEADRAVAEHHRQIGDIRSQLDRVSSNAANERANLMRTIEELRR